MFTVLSVFYKVIIGLDALARQYTLYRNLLSYTYISNVLLKKVLSRLVQVSYGSSAKCSLVQLQRLPKVHVQLQ